MNFIWTALCGLFLVWYFGDYPWVLGTVVLTAIGLSFLRWLLGWRRR